MCFRTQSIRKDMERKRFRYPGRTSVSELAGECEPDAPYALVPYLCDEEIDVNQLGEVLMWDLLSCPVGKRWWPPSSQTGTLRNLSLR